MPMHHQQHQQPHMYPQQGYNNHQNQMRGQNNMIPQPQRYMHPNPNYYSGFVPPPPPPPGQYHPPHE